MRKKKAELSRKIKPIGRQALYSLISCDAKSVIERLKELSQSKNENVALGACKVLINKILPDISSIGLLDLQLVEHQKGNEIIDIAVDRLKKTSDAYIIDENGYFKNEKDAVAFLENN